MNNFDLTVIFTCLIIKLCVYAWRLISLLVGKQFYPPPINESPQGTSMYSSAPRQSTPHGSLTISKIHVTTRSPYLLSLSIEFQSHNNKYVHSTPPKWINKRTL